MAQEISCFTAAPTAADGEGLTEGEGFGTELEGGAASMLGWRPGVGDGGSTVGEGEGAGIGI